jgi:glycopeptide antibiotics resistance protein
MSFSALQEYARGLLGHIPWEHWVVMAVVALAWTVILLIRKKYSMYGAIAWGLTVFMALFLLDTAVGIRYLGLMKHTTGHNLTLDFSRMFQKSGQGPVETLSNIAVFVPFGFFLGEWLASSNRTGSWRRVGLVTLAAFGLSLCIECLQLVLKVGFFEVTDLVMNTVGGVFGGVMSVGVRKVVLKDSGSSFYNKRRNRPV